MRMLANGQSVEDFVSILRSVGGTDSLVQGRRRAEETLNAATDETVRQRSRWLMEEIDKHLIGEHGHLCACSALN